MVNNGDEDGWAVMREAMEICGLISYFWSDEYKLQLLHIFWNYCYILE